MVAGVVSIRRICLYVAAGALLGAAAPAPASADVYITFRDLVGRQLSPTPLVPTTAPASLRPIDETIRKFATSSPRGYGIVLAAPPRSRPAVIALSGGTYRSVSAARKQLRRLKYRARSTRVRSRRGYLLTRTTTRLLLWAEEGRVYTLATNTPRTVSVAGLQEMATNLDRLGGAFVGESEDSRNTVDVVTTQRTATVDVDFQAPCTASDGLSAGSERAMTSGVLVPRQGDAFTFDVAPGLRDPGAWQGTVSGNVGPNGGTVEIRAATVNEFGDRCDTGALSLGLRPYQF